MKQTLKTILAGLLVLTMLFTAAACGGNGGKDDDTNKPATDANDDFFTDTEVVNSQEEEVTQNETTNTQPGDIPDENKIGGKSWADVLASMPKKLKGTKVVLYNWNPAAEYTGAPKVLEDFKKETGITVEWMRINYTEYVTKLAGLIAAKDSPDVVRTRMPMPERLEQFQSLDTANYDFTDAAWDKIVMKDYTVNGVTYATSLKNTHLGSVGMMFYNKSLIEKYDMEDPYRLWKDGKWTLSKFVSMCQEFAKEHNTSSAATGMTYNKWTQMYGIADNIAYENGKFVNKMGDAKFLTITQQFADHYNTNKIFSQGQAEIFDSSGALFYAGASVYARKKNSYFGTLKAEGNFYAVPMPSVDGQGTYYQQKDEYEAYAIARGAKNPKAVPYLLRYFLDGANYELDSFFCNKQNLEVYNWCMSQENSIWGGSFSSGGVEEEEGWYNLTGNQIKSLIDRISPAIDKQAKELNDAMAKLGK